MKNLILPEDKFDYYPLSMGDVIRAKRKKQHLTGIVTQINPEQEDIIVELGHNIYGHMSFSNSTIYPFTYSSKAERNLPYQIAPLLHKKIRVTVLSTTGGEIILSRKDVMSETIKRLAKELPSVQAQITCLRTDIAYLDVGCGIYGMLHLKDFCATKIHNFCDFIHKGQFINVKLTGEKQDKFFASFKEIYRRYNPEEYPAGSQVYAIITDVTSGSNGAYYSIVTPQIRGIVNVSAKDKVPYYGQRVFCEVISANDNFLRLRHIPMDPENEIFLQYDNFLELPEMTS